jgi:hypothetical protein
LKEDHTIEFLPNGFFVKDEKNKDYRLYRYSRKFRIAKVYNNDCMYLFQVKKFLKWTTILIFDDKNKAIHLFNDIRNRRKMKIEKY